MDYDCRLATLGIWSLEERRNRADMIEVFKILKGFSGISPGDLFEPCNDSRTRGHSLKLAKHRSRTDLRKYFFSERVVSRWNMLDQHCVDATSINAFKARLSAAKTKRMGLFK